MPQSSAATSDRKQSLNYMKIDLFLLMCLSERGTDVKQEKHFPMERWKLFFLYP